MSKRLDEIDKNRAELLAEGYTLVGSTLHDDMAAVIRAVGVECEGHHQATSDDEDSCDCLLCEAYRKFEGGGA